MRDSRHNARILALQKLFEDYFHSSNRYGELSEKFSLDKIKKIDEIEIFDEKLYNLIIENLPKHVEEIDKIISILAPEWPIEKIAPTDLQILRVAILEGFILTVTPEKVAIDEAIELTKEFCNDQSRKFVSGVLGNLIENKYKYLQNGT